MDNKKLPIDKNKYSSEVYKTKKYHKLSKKHYDFLDAYARTHNKQAAMKEAGLNLKADGTEYPSHKLNIKADMILRNEDAQEYMRKAHEDILKNACLHLERAVAESYDLFLLMKEKQKWREMNIAYATFLELSGFLTKNKQSVNVNTQIVDNGNGITINYIPPEKKDE